MGCCEINVEILKLAQNADNVLLFAGTTEGRELFFSLLSQGMDVTASVATEYGFEILQSTANEKGSRSDRCRGRAESDAWSAWPCRTRTRESEGVHVRESELVCARLRTGKVMTAGVELLWK